MSLGYTDPDGGTAVCTNTEQADIHVEIDDRQWSVLGTGHAEVGLRGARGTRHQRKDHRHEFSTRPAAAVRLRSAHRAAGCPTTAATSPKPPPSASSSPDHSGSTTTCPGSDCCGGHSARATAATSCGTAGFSGSTPKKRSWPLHAAAGRHLRDLSVLHQAGPPVRRSCASDMSRLAARASRVVRHRAAARGVRRPAAGAARRARRPLPHAAAGDIQAGQCAPDSLSQRRKLPHHRAVTVAAWPRRTRTGAAPSRGAQPGCRCCPRGASRRSCCSQTAPTPMRRNSLPVPASTTWRAPMRI